MKPRLSERQRVRGFLILLVTFLIKEKSDRRRQAATPAPRLGRKRIGSKGLLANGAAVSVVSENPNNGEQRKSRK
ncbi:hypothetical protein TH63_04240 [Rufibacter radiotolerans]|uniref:Uncharacterized protein n=1 Tax=Rufibacter radiotolerans TaxID=1379910 RepID=A0A0H4VML9_9BACT|nr:hypothetical protein TH63_04240 [Rufibacter radiotolerans]